LQYNLKIGQDYTPIQPKFEGGGHLSHTTEVGIIKVVLGGVMVIVFAIVPKVCWFKPNRDQWIFKRDKSP
jgi:hypothetical protein